MQIVHTIKEQAQEPDLHFLKLEVLDDPIAPFEDNLEAVQFLETEARVLLAIGRSRKNGSLSPRDKQEAEEMATYAGTMVDSCPVEHLEEFLDRARQVFQQRAAVSRDQGGEVLFESFCRAYDLDANERSIVLLLFMCSSSQGFRTLYGQLLPRSFDRDATGMDVETLLSVLSGSLREQLTLRRYFSADSRLLHSELISSRTTTFDQTPTILDQVFAMDQRVANFIIGDHNLYNLELACIRKEQTRVDMDQVILDPAIKDEVIQQAESFLAGNHSGRLEEFFGYGTGLTYFFHGPSGTGKTMLAHALARRLGKMLFNINTQAADSLRLSIRDIVAYVFREARLSGGIVFFDECDDMFVDGTSDSQALLTEIEKAGCITILASNKQSRLDPALHRRVNMKVGFAIPEQCEREAIWQALIPGDVTLAEDVDFARLARDFVFSGGLIKNAILMAVNASGKGASAQTLTMAALVRAATYQADNHAADMRLGSLYRPTPTPASLLLHPRDKRKIEQLGKYLGEMDGQELGGCIVLQCDHLVTAIEAADALAGACGLHVARFSLDQMLSGFHPYRNELRDPVTQKDVTSVEYAFAEFPGFRSVTCVVDHSTLLDPVFKGEGNLGSDLQTFLFEMGRTSRIVLLVTRKLTITHPPAGTVHIVGLDHPSEAGQIEAWRSAVPEGMDAEREVVDFVERHPLHIREIEDLAKRARAASLIRTGSERDGFFEQLERMVRRNKTAAPLLFGQTSSKTNILDRRTS